MLFKVRSIQREERPKNQVPINQILAFRDTWTEVPNPGFSVDRVLMQSRLEKQRKAEIPKLVMSENGFRVRDKTRMDSSELELRRVQCSLNKLTDQNFDAVTADILSHDLICDKEILCGAVNIIFTKAVAEPVFSALYARLCARISNYEREVLQEMETNVELKQRLQSLSEQMLAEDSNCADPLKYGFVRTALVQRCQKFFQNFVLQSEHSQNPGAATESPEAEDSRRKMDMANIKFVGELYNKSLVTGRVIISIAAQNLGLGPQYGVSKTTACDADLEMVYNLLTVVGKRVDEAWTSCPHVGKTILDKITALSTDKNFSLRNRFLLQNLLDWRAGGYKPKDTAPLVSSSANTESNQNQQKSMPRVASAANHQDGRPMMRRQDRVTSYNDLNHFNNHSSSYIPPPPPPFVSPNLPPPPFPEVPQLNEEDRKLMALAQPPKCFTKDVESSILSIVRDSVADGDWAAADSAILERLSKEADHICRQCAVYALIKKVALSAVADDRDVFSKALKNDIFSEMALTRGFSWFLTEAISTNAKEDVPMVLSRFSRCVVDCMHLTFLGLLRDVIARTANYLDALYSPLDGAEGEWEEDFVTVCGSLLDGWCSSRSDDKELHDPEKILTCIASVKQRPFMRDTAMDFISELMGHGLITETAVQIWMEANTASEKFKPFMEQLVQLC